MLVKLLLCTQIIQNWLLGSCHSFSQNYQLTHLKWELRRTPSPPPKQKKKRKAPIVHIILRPEYINCEQEKIGISFVRICLNKVGKPFCNLKNNGCSTIPLITSCVLYTELCKEILLDWRAKKNASILSPNLSTSPGLCTLTKARRKTSPQNSPLSTILNTFIASCLPENEQEIHSTVLARVRICMS